MGFIGVIVLRLFYLQVITPTYYSADYTRTRTIKPERGRILDRNREPLAVNQTKYLTYVEPKKIDNMDYLRAILKEELKMDEASLEARIQPDKDWVAIKSGVTSETKKKLQSYNIKGIGFQDEAMRYYPEASLAAHLTGFLGKKTDGEGIGYFGIEGFYDKDLTGLPGVLKSERDLMNRPIFVGQQERIDAENGRDIVLTIDKSVQHIMKTQLQKGVEQFEAKAGCAIAVKPQTMEILGLTCLPDFDPELYYEYPQGDFVNWAVSSTYEPGSTFKPLIVAAAIEEKKVKPTDIFNEEGPVEIGGYTVSNWNDKYDGEITIARALEKSSNVGMVHIGAKLGNNTLYKYLTQKYRLNTYTNIDLQGEAIGRIKPMSEWYPIDAATMSFGQGISISAMQLVRSFASLINGGYLLKPYVVKEIVEEGKVKVREPQVQEQILSERTSAIMRKMLASTVLNAEAKWDIPEGFTFGGKTGTAQIAVQGTYDASKTIASFIGFAPVEDPAFLMLVVIQEPQSSSWGSETAAPIFFDIARDMLVYYNVAPR